MDSLAQSKLIPDHTPQATESFRESLQTGWVGGGHIISFLFKDPVLIQNSVFETPRITV